MKKTLLAAIGIAMLVGGPALAVTQTFSFSAVVTKSKGLGSGDPSGTFIGEVGTGTVSYDDAALNNSGNGSFDGASSFKLAFNFLGQSYTGANDKFANDATFPGPFLKIQNNKPYSLSFEVDETKGFGNSTDIAQKGIVGFSFDAKSIFPTGDASVGSYALGMHVIEGDTDCCKAPQPVPLPATLPLLGFGIGLIGWAGMRRKQAA